jgi:hypothetical protein
MCSEYRQRLRKPLDRMTLDPAARAPSRLRSRVAVADTAVIAAARPFTMLLALLGLSAAVIGVFGAPGDYPQDAGPAIAPLSEGHLAAALHSHALMGIVSLLLRAPAVALTHALGLGATATYRTGALVCFVPVAVLGA